MNLVAHQLLSFNDKQLQLGNLLGEVVRVKDWENYTPELAKGILLHRHIDAYTDKHSLVKACCKKLHSSVGKFAPVAVDMAFDYYLIKDWNTYCSIDFSTFKQACYRLFKQHIATFPKDLQHFVYYLVQEDWFANYATEQGQQQTLTAIGKRTPYQNNLDQAWGAVQQHNDYFKKQFALFFPELMESCTSWLENYKAG